MATLGVLLSFLVALTTVAAQLNISATFTATGEAEWHVAEETFFGTFIIGRDHANKMGIEEAKFTIHSKDDVEKVIQHYDIKTATYVRGPPANPSCNNQTRNGTLSPFWEWTANAVFEGDQEIRERVYDLWSYATGDVRLEVLLEKGNKTRPFYFNRKTAEGFVKFSIMEFSNSAPQKEVFNVPKECWK